MSDEITLVAKSPEDLERDDLVRQTLEAAAVKLETHAVGELYAKAYRSAAKLVRSMKYNKSIPDV